MFQLQYESYFYRELIHVNYVILRDLQFLLFHFLNRYLQISHIRNKTIKKTKIKIFNLEEIMNVTMEFYSIEVQQDLLYCYN